MDALQFYLLQMKQMAGNGWANTPDGQHWRTPEGRREFAGRGIKKANQWVDGWDLYADPSLHLTCFVIPDKELDHANLRQMLGRFVSQKRGVFASPDWTRITTAVDGDQFPLILDEIDRWRQMSTVQYTHRRFGCNPADKSKRNDWGSSAFKGLSGDTSPYDWSMFLLDGSLESIAFGRDVKAVLNNDCFIVDVIDGQELYVRFKEHLPYGDGESEELFTRAADEFCDMYDRFLVDGVYNWETLRDVYDEIEVQLGKEFADAVVNKLGGNAAAIERMCQQFFGREVFDYIWQLMEDDYEWEDGAAEPAMYLWNPQTGERDALYVGDRYEDWSEWADMVNLYAEYLRQMYQDHLDGKVTLVAYDQPELLEVE